MISLSDQHLEDFQQVIPWTGAERLPDGRVLGKADDRLAFFDPTTPLLSLVKQLSPADKTILELGACEGYFTVRLAKLCKEVVAVEVRPTNIVALLTRLFIHEVTNVRCVLKDARDLDARFGKFDLIFHSGLLYHLSDPVEHLSRIRDMADDLLLNTHYCTDDTSMPRADIYFAGKTYRAHVFQESGWKDPWSGVEPTSRWLHRDALLELLHDLGFDSVEVVFDSPGHPNGQRMTVLARRGNSLSELPVEARVSLLKEQLADARRGAEWAIAQLSQQRTVASKAEQRAHEAHKLTEVLRSSWTWQMGRLLIAPVRALRSIGRSTRTLVKTP
jgi:hypothetical protein